MKKLKIILPLCIVLYVTIVSFYPSLNNGFTNWDDDYYVVKNNLIREISWKNIKEIFSTFFVSHYAPLTVLSFAIEYHYFGLNQNAYHTTNLILHMMNCVLVFWLFLLISGSIWITFFVTIFFAVHPMHVEAVAWVSERKDVLYSFFFLGALISYIYYVKQALVRYFIFSVFLLILSLLVKSMAVTFPLLLFVFDYYTGRKFTKTTILEKVAYLIPAVFFGMLSVYSEGTAINRALLYSYLENFIFFFYRSLFYFVKMFLPINLSCLYPYPEKLNGSLPLEFLLSPIIFLLSFGLLIFLMIKLKHLIKTVVFGFLFFYITIAPVMQFIPVGQAIVADRYTYIPYLGLFFMLAFVMARFYENYVRKNIFYVFAFAFLLTSYIGFLGYLTWDRCHVWKDSVTLWSDFISKYPNSVIGYNNRGSGYYVAGNFKNAIIDYQTALKIKSNHVPTHFNLCLLYKDVGQYQDAIIACKRTIELKNDYIEAYSSLGDIYLTIGKNEEAVFMYKKAIEKDKKFVPAYLNIGVVYYFEKKYDLSYEYFKEAVHLGGKVHPDFDAFIRNYPIQNENMK